MMLKRSFFLFKHKCGSQVPKSLVFIYQNPNQCFTNSTSRNIYSISKGSIDSPVYQYALKHWDKVAIEDCNREFTYGEIYTKSSILSKWLQGLVRKVPQQHLASLLPNDISYVITQWATWKAGHVAIPLHPAHPETQLEYFLKDSNSSLIITNEELKLKYSSLLSGRQVMVLETSFLHSKDDNQLVEERKNAQKLSELPTNLKKKISHSNALIIYTSGTTGPPKGVVLKHKNIYSQVQCLLEPWGFTSSDVLLHCLPLHHLHGIINALLCPLFCGARVIMEPEFQAGSVWGQLLNLSRNVTSRVNLFMAVPTIYAKLIEEYDDKLIKNAQMKEYVKQISLENIRLMVSGSASLPVPILEKWREITGHTLLERYGMTEIGMALSNSLNGKRIPGFVGSPLPGVKVRIVRFSPKRDDYDILCESTEEGTKVMPGCKNEAGELLVKGPNVFHEYWNNEEATKKEFTHDGWFCTGDTCAFIDGNYKILGRTSVDIIKSGGFKISALDVERHLLSHPHVRDVAVVGVPDVTWGEKVAALIVCKDGKAPLSQTDLREWAKEKLPHYQVPSVVKCVSDSLPRNNMGKLNKKQLLNDFFGAEVKK